MQSAIRIARSAPRDSLIFPRNRIWNTWTGALLQFKNRATLVTRPLVNSLEHARRE